MAASHEQVAPRRTVRVTPKAVDAARARVEAYRRLGITPDPVLVRLAETTYARDPRPAQ